MGGGANEEVAAVGLAVLCTVQAGAGLSGQEPRDPHGEEGGCVKEMNEGIGLLMRTWREALAAGDLDVIADLVTEDAEFWTHGQPPLRGRDGLKEAFKPFLEQYRMDQEFQCQELIVLQEWAFMRGLEVNRLRGREAEEEETVIRQRAFSLMRRGEDGVWRFHRGMTNQPPKGEEGSASVDGC